VLSSILLDRRVSRLKPTGTPLRGIGSRSTPGGASEASAAGGSRATVEQRGAAEGFGSANGDALLSRQRPGERGVSLTGERADGEGTNNYWWRDLKISMQKLGPKDS